MSKFDHLRGTPGSRSRLAAQVWEGARVGADPAVVPESHEVPVPDELRATIEHHMASYPDRHSAVLPALRAAQRDARLALAGGDHPGRSRDAVTPAYLESIASFYDMLELEPVGRHTIYVCTNISCQLRGRPRPARIALGGDGCAGERLEPRRRVPPALVRVPGRVRHRADGVDRGPLPRPARRPRTQPRSPSTCGGGRARTCCPTPLRRRLRPRAIERRRAVTDGERSSSSTSTSRTCGRSTSTSGSAATAGCARR